jgi:hypothetical protein
LWAWLNLTTRAEHDSISARKQPSNVPDGCVSRLDCQGEREAFRATRNGTFFRYDP